MSAKERVRIHLGLALSDPAVVERLLQGALDEHAHELAEEARETMGPRELPNGLESDVVARFVLGWHAALDRIDPEVEK